MKLRHAEINIEKLRKCENQLFDSWRNSYDNFIPDGCADCEKYSAAPIRLLFVLKEVNGGENWDLRDYMNKGCRNQTWNVISRWVEGIFNYQRTISWAQLSKNNEKRRKEYISQVCAVNLKKTPGTYVADSNLIQEAVEKDKAFLKEQIQLYQADIIILCGIEKQYQFVMNNSPKWLMTSRGVWYYIDDNGSIVVSYSHPEARTKKCLLHYGLIDAIIEILNNN